MPNHRRYTVFALMLAMFLTAIDVTIVETALPRIVGALGGFSMLTWLVTAYMLTSTASVPVYGKLADLFGRKAIFTVGATIFVVGSALCGLAQSMTQLILFRALQGLGAGAVQPVVQTIIGDLFAPAERAKMQGWFSAVWGFSALVGPLIGGTIVDHASWRVLFFVNLPLGILALLMVWRHLEEKLVPRKVQADYLGFVTMTAGLTTLLMALQLGGSHYAWTSPPILALFASAAVMLVVFVWQEGRAPDPMLPLGLFRMPALGISVLASFMVGGILYGFSVYLPLWTQGVQGYSATASGLSLLWLSIGWPLAAVVGGKFIMKLGVRPSAVLGLVLNAVAALGLVILGRTASFIPSWSLALLTFTIGAGMGFSTLAFILAAQNSVEWVQRGVVTASVQFMRTLGGMIWVSAMGGVMNLSFVRGLTRTPGFGEVTGGRAGELANELLDPKVWRTLPPSTLATLRELLAAALRNVHLLVLLAAVVALAITFFLPNMRFDKQHPAQSPQGSTGGES